MKSQPILIGYFLQGKDLIQSGTFSIPIPYGGVNSNYLVTFPSIYCLKYPNCRTAYNMLINALCLKSKTNVFSMRFNDFCTQ
jgi:hypothetical protein